MVEWVLGWVKKKGFVEGSKEQGNENWKFYWYYGPFDEDCMLLRDFQMSHN